MRKIHLVSLVAGLAILASGCATTGQQACMAELEERYPNYTEDERLALFYGAKGIGCIHEWLLEVTRDQEGNVSLPQIAYHKVQLDKLLAVEESQLADLDQYLDTSPKNEEVYRILEEMGLRPYFEAMERAGKFRFARLQLRLNHDKFRQLLGELDTSSAAEEKRRGYTAQIFLPQWDPTKEAPFIAKYIEDAKQNNRLNFVGMTTVFDYELFAKKEPDPEVPWDPNRFVWKERVEGLEIRLYRVMNGDKPRDNQPHYLEAVRLTHHFDKEGKITKTEREPKPALRAFVSPSDNLDIVVLDQDRAGELGFGLPDVVEKLARGIANGKDLYVNHQPLLAQLFLEKVQDRRKPLPKPDPQKLEVAKAGTPVDPWEKAPGPQGWSVPHEYQNEKKDNYQTEIVFVPRRNGDDSTTRQIRFIAKIWHAAANEWQPSRGEVIEYYRPLPEFAQKNILEASIDFGNKKRITVEREGSPSVSGIVNPGKNVFIEERPVAIDFTDGDTRWRIVDRDKTGVYMYRMEISRSNGASADNDFQ